DNLPQSNSLEFIKGSIVDKELVDAVVKGKDIIFHCAARNIIISTKDPMEDMETNIRGTLNVLIAAQKYGIEKVVYTSSASVYGNPRYLPMNEDDPLSILTPYAVSKLSGEQYCSAFYESYSLPTVSVRYSNIYGPKQSSHNPYCGVVAKFFDAALKRNPIHIHGDGEQTRDFTYVDDAVEATLLAALLPRAVGEVFNVGTGIETNLNELARKIIALYDHNIPIEYVDRRDIDNIRRRFVNIEKIRKKLRWIPMVILGEGLKEL
ncbi:unnamed protein product, partial [marine sediment metagenome]